MQLVDHTLIKNIIGHLMHDPSILNNNDYNLEHTDFKDVLPRYVFAAIRNMTITSPYNKESEYDPSLVDSYIHFSQPDCTPYTNNNGLEFLKQCYGRTLSSNFKDDYDRLKKFSLLRSLQKHKYDISYYYKEIPDTNKEEIELLERFENDSIEDILNRIEGNLNVLREHYVCGGNHSGNVAEGVVQMVSEFAKTPEIGVDLSGSIFSTCCRGARKKKFYLRSGSSGSGKTRLSVFDSCKICFPVRWDSLRSEWIEDREKDEYKNVIPKQPRKVLFITTEQDKEEIQTIILAYLSGVNEDKIITGRWNEGEKQRIDYAIYLMEKYKDYYFLDEISDPNLTNVSNMIKKYVTMYGVEYVFYDYIFSSPSLVTQFQAAKVREDVALGMLANQLKQIAKDYDVFIQSSTQLNSEGMGKPGFKNENCLRGAKALADKADMGCIAQQVNQEEWSTNLESKYLKAINEGKFDENTLIGKILKIGRDTGQFEKFKKKVIPTHVVDIYKMRRGRYKNIRIWYYINLGTGERYDLFMTDSGNSFIDNLDEFDIMGDDSVIHDEKWIELGRSVTYDG